MLNVKATIILLTVGLVDKAKGRISKLVFQENKAHQIIRKKQTFLILHDKHMHVCISWGKKCLVFQKIWHALFSGNPHFKIHPFTLLPMNYAAKAH